MNKNLAVGEVDEDAIGCFLFGIEATPLAPISYVSLATTPADLIADCEEFFNELVLKKQELARTSAHSTRHQQDLKILLNARSNLPHFIGMYLTSDRREPFLEFGGITLFLRTGSRQRQKVHGRYIE